MAAPKSKDQAAGSNGANGTNGETRIAEEKPVEKPKEEVRLETSRETRIAEEKPGVGMRENDDLPPARSMRRRYTTDDLQRNADDIADHFGDELPKLVELLAKQVGSRLVPDDGQGKTPTGKYVVRHGIKAQPKGEDKVRTVRPGEVVSLSEADAEFFMKKKSRPIEPELV